MRKWLIVALVIVALVGGGAVVIATNLNRYLERNHEWLRSQVEAAIARPVAFDRVRVSLWGGVGARVDGVRIGDDPAWGGGDMLRADGVEVSLHLLPALVGRYEIGRVRIERPALRVVRGPQGLNVAALGHHASGTPAEHTTPDAREAPEGSGTLAALLVSRFELHDASLALVDRTTTPSREAQVDHLNITVSDIGLGQPVRLLVTADVLGEGRGPLKAEGTVGPVRDMTGVGAPVDVTLHLGPLDLSAIAAHPPPGVTLPGGVELAGSMTLDLQATGTIDALRLRGEWNADPARLRVGQAFDKKPGTTLSATLEAIRTAAAIELPRADMRLGRLALVATGRIALVPEPTAQLRVDGEPLDLAGLDEVAPALEGIKPGGTASVHLQIDGPLGGGQPPGVRGRFGLTGVSGRVGGTDIQSLEVAATIEGDTLALERCSLRVFGGTVSTSGHLDFHDRARPRLDGKTTVRALDVDAALKSRAPTLAGRCAGALDADAAISGAGASWEQLRPTLRGTAHGTVRNAMLKEVNLIDDVLGKSSGIPGLSTFVPPKIRSKYPALFSTGDTRFDQMEGDFRIGDERVTTENLVASAREFTASAKGTIGFDGRTDLNAMLVTSPALSSDVVGEVKEARFLVQKDGRLAIPFQVVGTAPNVHAQPDVGYLTNTVGRGLLDQGVEGLLGGRKKSGDSGKSKDQQDMLQKGLKSLFGR